MHYRIYICVYRCIIAGIDVYLYTLACICTQDLPWLLLLVLASKFYEFKYIHFRTSSQKESLGAFCVHIWESPGAVQNQVNAEDSIHL